MRLPGFNAETSLYKSSRHYRMMAKFGNVDGPLYPMASIYDLVYVDTRDPARIWARIQSCCHDCLQFPCADEECRRQRAFDCDVKCGADAIGGCGGGCPKGRVVCDGACCEPGDVCTLDGCASPNAVCNNRICFGHCLPEGCCTPDRVVCNNHCCQRGESCTSEGCCPPGVCCEFTACPPGKFCCGGKVCCPNGTDCRLVHGTSEYGCFH